jgi:hypothetical protein
MNKNRRFYFLTNFEDKNKFPHLYWELKSFPDAGNMKLRFFGIFLFGRGLVFQYSVWNKVDG